MAVQAQAGGKCSKANMGSCLDNGRKRPAEAAQGPSVDVVFTLSRSSYRSPSHDPHPTVLLHSWYGLVSGPKSLSDERG